MARPGQVILQLSMFEAGVPPEANTITIGLGLAKLAECQKPMLEKLGFDNTSTETLSRYGMGLIIEVAEFLNETPWKSWPKDPTKQPDLERITEEFVDMISYLGSWINFMNMLGISTENIALAYKNKLAQNNQRFGVEPDAS